MGADRHYTLFDTDYGICGIAWTANGVCSFNFPEADPAETEARLARFARPATDIPETIDAAIRLLRRYFSGEAVDLSVIAVDLGGVAEFPRQVYQAALRLGWGETVTYGELAQRIGAPGAARAVGHALGRNPVAIIVPCHRVLASGNRLGGFSAFGGTASKARLLAMEGVAPRMLAPAPEQPSLFDFLAS